ncbi:hypothetical protein L211DRAFT_870957 [Terfezia boudieri ATCC MYA-4762]|uniref:Uncharacterized protein n=1 Tax=Terfezia boudieri ATCC MYA-4762 TaxID=1051890 RepID=A0A3N4LAU1_9PEZI|nr:hypothetical protein L211DRAFT_870957 [Terfezia boudieri ATCC MYA-4762]
MPQIEHNNLGCEEFAKSLFPNFPEKPEDSVLKKQAKSKHLIHLKTFQMSFRVAADYYDAAKSHLENFRHNRHPGDPIKQFKDVVDFFSVKAGTTLNVRDFMNAARERDPDGSTSISPEVVMRILAIWLCIPGLGSSTVIVMDPEEHSKSTISTATGLISAPTVSSADIPLGDLIARCLPHCVNFDGPGHLATNRKHLFTKSFNGEGLRNVAGLEFEWTRDITEHLQLEDRTRTVKLFKTAGFCYYANYCTALSPCDEVTRYPAGSKFPDFTQEVSRTFELLFGSTPGSRKVLYDDLIKNDPTLQNYIHGRPDIGEVWTCDWKSSVKPRHNYMCGEFPYFGQRLMELEEILKEAHPTSLRQLFRDSRNTLQYWTFITAIAVLVLALISMILQLFQAVAAYIQISKM